MKNIKRDVNKIIRFIRRENGQNALTFGLGQGEMRTLHFIHHTPGVTQREISERFGIDKAATARQCASLEGKGFIRREKNKNDGRSFCLFPTEKAESLKKENLSNEDKVFAELTQALSDSEKEELEMIISKICAVIDEKHEDKGERS